MLAPLGLCLGMFMPLGLGRVASLTEHGEEYVAWAWAVNGFFAVIGSVLTTILSMALGFRVVQFAALGVYAIAAFAFTRLPTPPDGRRRVARRRAAGSAPSPSDGAAPGRSVAGPRATGRHARRSPTAASTASDGSAAARKRVCP